ncbi:TetR/AcrR family transcriptional regulator [Pseudomonas sp. BP8]|uniref:TetR/AcrR family transcriptional regulator n=1 Tax=Pseudomonas sp. BP8 TaxID=2817864 RepID=UPI001AE34388|nr:TetR/AcrR family transcriptional regulator [Pseudomonas sp. BP8]MBP2261565.1 AcrR family transcriptional regulator [Pseudomonas sp. BP8]HDS1733474.1 TetR/AcrR family transcriptional regulator [Pseudomonas putida]
MTDPNEKSARDRILEGACELFSIHGYQAIGLRDLADHVGIKAGSLYHHIESKQSLLFELMEDAISELLYCTRLNLRRKAQAHERLNCFIDTFLDFKRSSSSRTNLLSREQINLSSEHASQFNSLKNEYIQILSDIIKDLLKINQLSPLTLSMATDAVIGMLFNQAQWLSTEVKSSDHSPVLKRFAYGIVATMNSEAA